MVPNRATHHICEFSKNSILLNHVLIFKYYLFNARKDSNLSSELLKGNIYKTENIEKEIKAIPKEL